MSAALQASPVGEVGDPAPAPLPRRSEAEVIARWSDGPPVVSVLCATFQHVGFIEDALRGFVGQDTDFPFEVIVRDDASTDGTAEIVRDYALQYPQVIRAILEPRNTFPAVRPGMVLRSSARGEFVAMCEGDDYWFSADKLQRPVNLLRERPDLALVVNAGVPIRDGRIIGPVGDPGWLELSPQQLLRADAIGIREMCFRATAAPPWRFESQIPNADLFLLNRLGLAGGARRIPDLVATVFRVHDGGTWTSRSEVERKALMATTHYWIGVHLGEAGEQYSAAHHLGRAAEYLLRSRLTQGIDPRPRVLARLVLALPGMVVRAVQRRLRELCFPRGAATARLSQPVSGAD